MALDALIARFGSTLTVWAANRTPNAKAGVNSPAWVNVGTVTGVLEEWSPTEQLMAGGAITSKTANLYLSDTDGSTVGVGNLVVADNGVVWRVSGEPVRVAQLMGHYEMLVEYVPNPPAGVLS